MDADRMRPADRLEYVRAAATEYVSSGWGVLPGSVFTDGKYTLGHTTTRVDGLVPVMVSGRTLRSEREVWSWWSGVSYSILVRVGEDFDVLTAPLELVRAAMKIEASPVAACPILYSAKGAQLLIKKHSRLRYDLRDVPGVCLVPQGALVPLPPTEIPDGPVRWWVAPHDVGYTLGLAGAVQATLAVAVDESAGGERR